MNFFHGWEAIVTSSTPRHETECKSEASEVPYAND